MCEKLEENKIVRIFQLCLLLIIHSDFILLRVCGFIVKLHPIYYFAADSFSFFIPIPIHILNEFIIYFILDFPNLIGNPSFQSHFNYKKLFSRFNLFPICPPFPHIRSIIAHFRLFFFQQFLNPLLNLPIFSESTNKNESNGCCELAKEVEDLIQRAEALEDGPERQQLDKLRQEKMVQWEEEHKKEMARVEERNGLLKEELAKSVERATAFEQNVAKWNEHQQRIEQREAKLNELWQREAQWTEDERLEFNCLIAEADLDMLDVANDDDQQQGDGQQ